MNNLKSKLQSLVSESKELILNFIKPFRANFITVFGFSPHKDSSTQYFNFDKQNKTYEIKPKINLKNNDSMINLAVIECLKHMKPLHAEILYYKTFEQMETSVLCEKYEICTARFWEIIHESRLELNNYLLEQNLI